MTAEHWLDLRCHPSTRSETVVAIQVLVRRSVSGELQMTFRLDGDGSRIRVPSRPMPGIGTELWRHTCFETFIAVEGRRDYHELNFAPSGEWTVYGFSGYRDGGPVASKGCSRKSPCVLVTIDSSSTAWSDWTRLSALHPRAPLRIGLSAVIETSDGFSYWALCHPIDKPDFHNAEGFVLKLEPPVSEG